MSRHDDGVGGGVYDMASQKIVGAGVTVGEGVHEKPLICAPFSSTRSPMSSHEMPVSEYTLAMAAATAW